MSEIASLDGIFSHEEIELSLSEAEERDQSLKPIISKRKYKDLIQQESDLVDSLASIRNQDLAAHLYNTHVLRRNDSITTASVCDQKTRKLRKSRGGFPRALWTAWPLPASIVPQDQKSKEEPDKSSTFALKNFPRDDLRGLLKTSQSHALEDILIGTTQRLAREKFEGRDWQTNDDDDIRDSSDAASDGVDQDISLEPDLAKSETNLLDSSSSTSSNHLGDESHSDTDSKGMRTARRTQTKQISKYQRIDFHANRILYAGSDSKDERSSAHRDTSDKETIGIYGRPVATADDDFSELLVQPAVRHSLARLDDILVALHHSRRRHAHELSIGERKKAAFTEVLNTFDLKSSHSTRNRPAKDLDLRRISVTREVNESNVRNRSATDDNSGQRLSTGISLTIRGHLDGTIDPEYPKKGRPPKDYGWLEGETPEERANRIARIQKKPLPFVSRQESQTSGDDGFATTRKKGRPRKRFESESQNQTHSIARQELSGDSAHDLRREPEEALVDFALRIARIQRNDMQDADLASSTRRSSSRTGKKTERLYSADSQSNDSSSEHGGTDEVDLAHDRISNEDLSSHYLKPSPEPLVESRGSSGSSRMTGHAKGKPAVDININMQSHKTRDTEIKASGSISAASAETLDDDDVDEPGLPSSGATTGFHSSDRTRTRKPQDRLTPRDWSEVIGAAALVGIPSDVIRRTANRCAALFGEGMALRYFVPGTAISGKSETIERLTPRSSLRASISPRDDAKDTKGASNPTATRKLSKGSPGSINYYKNRTRSRSRSMREEPSSVDEDSTFTFNASNDQIDEQMVGGYLICPFDDCHRERRPFSSRGNLQDHLRRKHNVSIMTNEPSSSSGITQTYDGVNLDNYLQPLGPLSVKMREKFQRLRDQRQRGKID